MKLRKLLLAIICIATWNCYAQPPGEWTWMHGDAVPNSLGTFGAQGVPNPAYKPPALYEPCEWKDNNGNLWLFGGANGLNISAALWKYDLASNQWTWMKGPSTANQPGAYGTQGVPSPANYPGSRGFGAVTWVDASGNLWLFGGWGYASVGPAGNLNDLWKYDIAANEWTWMNGPGIINDPGSYGVQGFSVSSNLPPSRQETSCSWTDIVGNLWLYGGVKNSTNSYGDLWKYTISSNGWAWIHGANTLNVPAVYGTQGVAAPVNTPGSRLVYSSWADLAGNLWLLGGRSGSNITNDLWKYDISTIEWTWMNGPNSPKDPGNYGTKCISANSNMPPARWENRARVRDACGNFWNFGGSSANGNLNDLWHYNMSTNQWTWVSGDNISGQAAVYGAQGVSALANKPGARFGNVAWIDNNGYFWVFGGSDGSVYNDLWRYVPDTTCVPASAAITVSSNTTICIGQSATLTASGSTSYAWFPGGQSTSSIVVNPTTSTTYIVIGGGSCGPGIAVTVFALPVASASDATICFGQNAALTASGGNNYSWSTGATTSAIITSPASATTYSVIVSIGPCKDTTNAMVMVNSNPTATASYTHVSCIGGNDGAAAVTASGGTPSYTYLWSPAGGTDSAASGLNSGIYTVTITDENGCNNTQTVTINPGVASGKLYLPNVFSPNNDGENDEFCLQGVMEGCIKELKMIIYSRWVEKIYESADPNFCWDGTYEGRKMNTAVFFYYMEATLISGKIITKKGNISLIR